MLSLTIKEIKARYRRTALGYGGSLRNPLVFAVTYRIAFKAILDAKIEGCFTFLLCLPVLAALALMFGRGAVSLSGLWGAPMLLVVRGPVIYGIALAVASGSVFFRDLERLIGLGWRCTVAVASRTSFSIRRRRGALCARTIARCCAIFR